jgi:hypothetical protein
VIKVEICQFKLRVLNLHVLQNVRNYSGLFSLVPPSGLEMRPVNDAHASTFGQAGRKEAAGREEKRRHAAPRQGPLQAPWNPLLNSYNLSITFGIMLRSCMSRLRYRMLAINIFA